MDFWEKQDCQSYVMEGIRLGYQTLGDLCSRAYLDGKDTASEEFNSAINGLIASEYLLWTADARNSLVPGKKFDKWHFEFFNVKVSEIVPQKTDAELSDYIKRRVWQKEYKLHELTARASLDGFLTEDREDDFKGILWSMENSHIIAFTNDRRLVPGQNYNEKR